MKKNVLILLSLAFLLGFSACKKKNQDIVSPYYLKFKYEGVEHNLSYCTYSRVNSKFYLQGLARNQDLLSISSTIDIQQGQTYDILSATPSNYSNFEISLNLGVNSYQTTLRVDNAEKVGEFTVTKITTNYINGTFFCELNIGSITEGNFSAKINK